MDTYLVNSADQPITAISTLATKLKDRIEGYKMMRGKADPELVPVLDRLITLHEKNASEVLRMLDRLGGNPDNAGSMMSAVHVAMAHARDVAGALDLRTLDAIVPGERALIVVYDDAVGAVDDADLRRLLSRQREALRAHVDAMEAGFAA